RYAYRRLGSARAAYFVAIAYSLYWGLQEALVFDFHEIAFAIPLIAFAIERIDAGRFAAATVAIALLVTVKEDLPLLVAFFGIFVAVKGRRALGAAIAAYGVAAYLLITKVAMPHFAGPGHGFAYWSYDQLGPDLPSALWQMVRHPWATVQLFVTPGVKWHTLLAIFAPFLFLPFGSSLILLTVPLLSERFFSSGHQYWVIGYHYSATIAPILAL